MDNVSMITNDGKPIVNYTWNDIDKFVSMIAEWITSKKIPVKRIYGIARGGLIPAVMLSHKLNLPLTSEQSFEIREDTLVVDDIEDSGNTMKSIVDWEKKCKRVVLISKQNYDRTNCDFYPEHVSINEWARFPWEV